MSRVINESDWRLFRKLEPIALDRFCERVLSEINQISCDSNKTSHQRYAAIFKLLERRDGELADAFNDLRRSTADQVGAGGYLRFRHSIYQNLFFVNFDSLVADRQDRFFTTFPSNTGLPSANSLGDEPHRKPIKAIRPLCISTWNSGRPIGLLVA